MCRGGPGGGKPSSPGAACSTVAMALRGSSFPRPPRKARDTHFTTCTTLGRVGDAEGEYDKIAPVIACTLPALTDTITERKRGELAGEVTSELQVVGKAASMAIQTWVRNNDKTKARAEEQRENVEPYRAKSRAEGGRGR